MTTYDDTQNKKTGIWIAVAAAILLVILVTSCGGDDEPARSSGGTETATRAAATTEDASSTEDPAAPLRSAASEALDAGEYDEAIALYEELGDDDAARRTARTAAAVLVGRARAAYRAGRYKTAERRAKAAIRRYGAGSAKGATRVWNQSRAKIRVQREQARIRAEARRIAREQRAAERREARRIAREQAAAELAAEEESFADDGGGGGGSYAGMNCDEIGHSFMVEPGSDPEHDRDNDGIACESQ
jgi:tetratricopeptide (TPR) repeat protein